MPAFFVVLLTILGALALLAAVVAARALMFRPRREAVPEGAELNVDVQRAAGKLSRMIRCKTVSHLDVSLVDNGEFVKFRRLLKTLYPNVHKTCRLEKIGPGGLLYHWKGLDSGGAPTVLMSHYDVVPAQESLWARPAFEGIIEDGVLWGRGTLDTKGTLLGVMESAEILISEGFVPQHDIYFSFGGDEEVFGADAPSIVDELERRGVRPGLVLDEGGAVVEGVFPGVAEPCALVGIGEKGMMNLEFGIKSAGGHASAPPPHGVIGRLGRAVLAVEARPFKYRLTPPVARMYDALGRHSSFAHRMIFANLWLFMPLLGALCKKTGGELNAMMRTTCAFTMAEASEACNVLPPEAKIVANLRILGGDTPQSAMEYIRGVIKDDGIELRDLHSDPPSPSSDMESEGYAKLKLAIQQTWRGAVVAPYTMTACSDSRHFCRISDNVMRFSAMALTAEQRASIHGHNERIPLEDVKKIVEFYLRLVRQL
jgi:carboxypeptidase PM20D1